MVRRALVGQVESYFEAQLLGSRQKLLEILERSQLRIDGLVSAFAGADRPGTANIFRQGFLGVVLSLAIHAADGVNRRKVENVEAHAGHVVQPLGAILQGSGAPGLRGAGTREHFVPGAEAGPLAIDDDRQFPAVGGGAAAVGVPDHQGFQLRAR